MTSIAKHENARPRPLSQRHNSDSTQERTKTPMDTNQSSPSLAPQAASNSINEEYPDPIPETHPLVDPELRRGGDLRSSEIFYDIEPDFDIPELQTRTIELTIQGHADTPSKTETSAQRATTKFSQPFQIFHLCESDFRPTSVSPVKPPPTLVSASVSAPQRLSGSRIPIQKTRGHRHAS
jgi:hypothetical protein